LTICENTFFEVVGLLFVGASASTYAFLNADVGLRRTVEFWWRVFPIYLHYRFYQLMNRDLNLFGEEYTENKYNELHDLYSDRVKEMVYSMRGFYLKNCQLMSTQVLILTSSYKAVDGVAYFVSHNRET